jgi:aminoglycoside phosphotransferase (APT) family kinase protein
MIDEEKLEAVLKERMTGGCDKLVSCERLSAGASRETYKLTIKTAGKKKALALRFAKEGGPSGLGQGPSLDVEIRLFQAAQAAGVPGPEIFFALKPEDELGSGFVMEWIEGETLGAKIARGSEFFDTRRRLARQCGEILAKLHKADVEGSGLARVLEEFTPGHAVRKTHSAYLELETPQPMIDYTVRWLMANLPDERPPTLVHSDFRNGNLIVDPKKGVVAVLDWELAHIGDPMRDLGWITTRSWRFGVPEKPVGGFGEYNELFEGYESVSGKKVDRAAVKFWEVFGSFWWAVATLSMAQSYRDGSNPSVERPAIGRRSAECQIDCVNMIIPDWGRKPLEVQRMLSTTALPRTDELLTAVRDFLRNDAATKLTGRDGFLARVAANSVDIVLRELALGRDAAAWELQSLRGLLDDDGEIQDLRAKLCAAIRLGEIDLKRKDLHAYLRDSVLAQAMIDQPGYAGTIEAMERG